MRWFAGLRQLAAPLDLVQTGVPASFPARCRRRSVASQLAAGDQTSALRAARRLRLPLRLGLRAIEAQLAMPGSLRATGDRVGLAMANLREKSQ